MASAEETSNKVSIAILQVILASEYVLLTKVRGFHWNVKGENFMMLHKMFGKMYSELNDQADAIAERIRQLQGMPNGTMRAFIDSSFIPETNGVFNAKAMIETLVANNEKLVSELKAAIIKTESAKDYGTMDMLIKWMQQHDQHLYFLRSHLSS